MELGSAIEHTTHDRSQAHYSVQGAWYQKITKRTRRFAHGASRVEQV